MNIQQQKIAEDCLIMAKYIPGRLHALQMEVEEMVPPNPGSVLKLTGRPMAKTPCDTSITERWGIIRATSPQAMEITAKHLMHGILTNAVDTMDPKHREMVRVRYGRELTDGSAMKIIRASPRQYYRIKKAVLQKVWDAIDPLRNMIDLAIR